MRGRRPAGGTELAVPIGSDSAVPKLIRIGDEAITHEDDAKTTCDSSASRSSPTAASWPRARVKRKSLITKGKTRMSPNPASDPTYAPVSVTMRRRPRCTWGGLPPDHCRRMGVDMRADAAGAEDG